MFIVTVALSSVVSEVFNVEKCQDLEIRVQGHSRPLKVVPFDRIGMVLKAESTEHKNLAYVIAFNEKTIIVKRALFPQYPSFSLDFIALSELRPEADKQLFMRMRRDN